MPHLRRLFGNKSEKLAAKFLQRAGYKILDTQFAQRFGEIDLIALDGDEVVFVEVKARRSSDFGYPEESVTRRKLEKIARVGEYYLKENGWERRPYRIDVIAIEGEGKGADIHHIVGVGA